MNQEQRAIIACRMEKAKREIWVTFTKESVHKYPGADSILAKELSARGFINEIQN